MPGRDDPLHPVGFRLSVFFLGQVLAGSVLAASFVLPGLFGPGKSFADPPEVLPGVPIDRKAVVGRALSSHPLLAIALDRIRAQSEKVSVAAADYYPHISVSLDQLFLNTILLGTVLPNYEPIAPEVFNPSLTQEITSFGRRHYRVSAERHLFRSRKEELNEARLTVLYHAEVAYDQLAMFEHLLVAARKNEKDALLHYKMAQERLARGFGVVTDVTSARILVEKTHLNVVQQENALKKAQADLVYAMGEEKMRPYRTTEGPSMEIPPMTRGQMIVYAIRHRPLLKAEIARDLESEDRVSEVRTRNYPHLSLFAQGLLLYGVGPSLTGAPAGSGLFLPAYQTGIVMTIPIFVGGEIVHETERARMEAKRESEKTRLVRIRIIRNIRKLYDDLRTQQELVALDTVRYAHANENERLVEKSFRKGLLDGVTALDAETELLVSRERLTADRFRFEMIRAGLDRETGYLGEERRE